MTASARHARPNAPAVTGVQAASEHRLQFLLADLAAGLEAELRESATDPNAGLLAGTQVVLARADRNALLVIAPGGAADLRRRQHVCFPRTDIATRRRHHTFLECICLQNRRMDYGGRA